MENNMFVDIHWWSEITKTCLESYTSNNGSLGIEGGKWGDSVEGRLQQYLRGLVKEEEEKNSKTKTLLTNDYMSISPLPEEHYMYTLYLSSFEKPKPASTILNLENW